MKNVFAGVGISKKDNSFEAGKESVSNAIEDMKNRGGKQPTFGFVFCSGGKYGKDDKTMKSFVDGAHSVFSRYKDCEWVGCTTAGELSPFGAIHNSAIAMVISSEYLRFGIGIGKNVGKNPKEAGKQATEEAFNTLQLDVHVDAYLQYMRYKKRKPKEVIKMVPYSIILLGKGGEKSIIPGMPQLYDMETVIDGIVEACGAQIPVVGGGAFDDWQLKKNYLFANGKVFDKEIIVIAMLNNVYFSTGLAHGYKPSGKVALVNKTKNMAGSSIVTQLNSKKPLDAYVELTKLPKDEIKKDPLIYGALHPFGVVDPSGESWVRVFGEVFMDNLIFGNNIKPNTLLHIMKGTKKDIFNAYKEAVEKALKQIENKKPAAVIVFSCACRNRFLGKEIGKEIDLFKKYFPDIPFIGFYSMNEFGGTLGNRMGVHTQSVTVLIITDELMV